jgi:hypothetical protein
MVVVRVEVRTNLAIDVKLRPNPRLAGEELPSSSAKRPPASSSSPERVL